MIGIQWVARRFEAIIGYAHGVSFMEKMLFNILDLRFPYTEPLCTKKANETTRHKGDWVGVGVLDDAQCSVPVDLAHRKVSTACVLIVRCLIVVQC